MARSGWHRSKDSAATAARVAQYRSPEHRRRRQAGQREVNAGHAHCWRCGTWLPPGKPWHLGHDDHDRTIYRGTECVPCNLGAAASKGGRVTAARYGKRHHYTPDTPAPRNTGSWPIRTTHGQGQG